MATLDGPLKVMPTDQVVVTGSDWTPAMKVQVLTRMERSMKESFMLNPSILEVQEDGTWELTLDLLEEEIQQYLGGKIVVVAQQNGKPERTIDISIMA